jgi:hypothetical protein
MSRLEIEWPDAGAERVRAAKGRLLHAREGLRQQSFEDRLTVVTEVLKDWTAPDSPWRRELSASLSAVSGFDPGTLSEGLDSALRAWDPEQFARCARIELAAPGRILAPFDWTTIVAGGAIPMPTLLSSLISLAAGSPVLLRETSKDPVTPGILARSIAARDEALGRCFEAISFPSTDGEAMREALAAPCVVATGSDETIRSISALLTPSQNFVSYGHRFSIAILGPDSVSDAAAMRGTAEGLALDVARWDQSGCLSPVIAYVVDIPSSNARDLTHAIAEDLNALSKKMPRGVVDSGTQATIATQRAEARMRVADGSGMLIEGADHTVVLEPDAQPRPAPLHRFLRLMPVNSLDDLNRSLESFSGHLSNAAISGLGVSRGNDPSSTHIPGTVSEDPLADFLIYLSRLGVSRVTLPGRMQTPPIDWPHDGRPLFTPVARFLQSDSNIR